LERIEKQLQSVDDLVGRIWPSNERPKQIQQPIVPHDTKYAGEDVTQKLRRTTAELKRAGATATIISALDEVAWQFNLRGADIPYNPFFKSYAIIYADYNIRQPELFINLIQLNNDIYPVGVKVFDYNMFWSHLNATATDPTIKKIWVSARVSQAILGSIPNNKLILPLLNSPVQRIKARKNLVERQGMRDCQIRDAVARMKHIGWIEQQLNNGISINETESADQLLIYQKQQDKFQLPSFQAISASGDRAAVVHYRPEPATARSITKNQVYLLDVSLYVFHA
jgi:Xaa-Pro aminopeptidase